MSDPTKRRMSRSTLGPKTSGPEGLLSSSGKVALIGLLTAIATLGFTVWLQVNLRQQNDVRVPLAQSAARLTAAINLSMVALGAWVAHQHEPSRARRGEVWRKNIQPELARIDEIARQRSDGQLTAQIDDLSAGLRELEYLQWLVEDLAHAPGNVPSRVVYEAEVLPLGGAIAGALGNVPPRLGPEIPAALHLQLETYRSAMVRVDRALLLLLEGHTAARARQVDAELEAAATILAPVKDGLPRVKNEDIRVGVAYALGEFEPYARAVRTTAQLRMALDWNLAAHTLRTQMAPVVARVQGLSQSLADAQNAAMVTSGRSLGIWGAVVVLLALIMGLLSAGSLYTSFRINFRMRQVLDKARMLGQYAIEERLGGGGMGEVYRARHAMLRRPTAIKLLRPRNAEDTKAQDRFRQEVQLTSQLTHPNTVDIFDYGRTPDGVFYYAMELLDGVDLQTLVRATGPLPAARAVHILIQVCGSLQEAHSKGLLHRDIKPSNIMLAERGGQFDTAKVLDFGLVQQLGATEEDAEPAGTPAYLAPEVIRIPNGATPRSDLYALGGVAYFLLTGGPVFEHQSVAEILRSQLEDPPERPSTRLGRPLPEGLDAIVLSCLSKDPEERPENAAHLAELLAECAVGVWSPADARAWWSDYGEALRVEAAAPASIATDLAEGLRVDRTVS